MLRRSLIARRCARGRPRRGPVRRRRSRPHPGRRQDADDLRSDAIRRWSRSTPLEALQTAARAGEFYAHVTASSFGNYVDQVGYYGGTGDSGWVFKVNGVSPPVGADQVQLKDGDTVEWYYATFGANGGPPTLVLTTDGARLLRRNGAGRHRREEGAGRVSSSAPARGRSPRRPGTSASRPHTGSSGRPRPARCARTACRDPGRPRRRRRRRAPRRLRRRRAAPARRRSG